jgi:hypothetical protein
MERLSSENSVLLKGDILLFGSAGDWLGFLKSVFVLWYAWDWLGFLKSVFVLGML